MESNGKIKLLFFEADGWEESILKTALPSADLRIFPRRLDESTPEDSDADAISVFVNSKVSEDILKKFSKLKLVATRSTGYDHIDANALSARGIRAVYVPGYGDNTVAEFAFGLLLNLTRKIYEGIDQIKERGLFSFEGLRGIDLAGKTLGVIGTGRIGRRAITIGRGFGMSVIACDAKQDAELSKSEGFTYVSLEELLARSDAITLHCPYNQSTHHLINRGNISKIKKGAYLINTARGGLIETDALVQALREGILAGAGLDVLEEEGEIKDEMNFLTGGHPREEELRVLLENHILMKMPNVLITPHNAFNSKEALERILNTTIRNISSFFDGKPINLVP